MSEKERAVQIVVTGVVLGIVLGAWLFATGHSYGYRAAWGEVTEQLREWE